ncbi:MAG TPA: YihY/virulence factor BrkB family protein [bacterium]
MTQPPGADRTAATPRGPLDALTQRLTRHVLSIARHSADDGVVTLATSIAYTALLSVFPMLILVIALLSIFIAPAAAQETVIDALAPYLPSDAVALVRDTLQAVVRTRGTASLVASLVLLWGATSAASTARHALNRVLKVSRPRSFLGRKLVEFALVILGGGFLSLSLIASTVLTVVAAVRPIAEATEAVRGSGAATLLAALGPWLFSAAAFLIVYRFLPNERVSWRSLLVGTAVAMLLFEAAKGIFFWYLRTLSGYSLVYGPLAGVIVFLVWVYLAAIILLIGGEVIAEMERTAPGAARA